MVSAEDITAAEAALKALEAPGQAFDHAWAELRNAEMSGDLARIATATAALPQAEAAFTEAAIDPKAIDLASQHLIDLRTTFAAQDAPGTVRP